MLESWANVTAEASAVKGPRVAGLDGTVSVNPPEPAAEMGTSKDSGPLVRVAGVAPVASI